MKYIHARDLVFCLKSPDNLERDLTLVPDVPVKLLLSTNGLLPDFISKRIQASENTLIFKNDSLMGLCLNGRELMPEIFLNPIKMQEIDPTGNMFEEICWHEYVHAIEGVEVQDNAIIRNLPWSYQLQWAMQEIDREQGHDGHQKIQGIHDSDYLREYVSYLRNGTSLQQNVSELFARVAAIYMINIRETGHAMTAGKDLFDSDSASEAVTIENRKEANLFDLFNGLATYSGGAVDLFVGCMPRIFNHIHALYGCRAPV